MVSPAEAGLGSVVAFTQDLRPGLILFRPDGLVPARSPALGRVGQIQRQNPVPSPGDSTLSFILPTVQRPTPAQHRGRFGPPVKRWAIIFRARGARIVPVATGAGGAPSVSATFAGRMGANDEPRW